ncbi:hypothetical protein L1049_010838 [Liquidambar formosana]|uniref:Uncharacterized protein n=1 Tax=Liquidambar formosana TaxID=63359 RepID=A0AAP0RW03_LIQFO
MHGFSTVDGFVEINECLAEMIKYVANEPSVGLFYIQQHTQNAVPNVIGLKNNVVQKSREMTLHNEDLEDSITVVSSMKECGFPIADEMIRDIKKSLVIMSTKEPRRGLINNPTSDFPMGRTRSWGPAAWGRSAEYTQQDGERRGGYLSTVLKSAKQKASNFKWSQFDSKESRQAKSEMLQFSSNPPPSVTAASTSSNLQVIEADELPLSSLVAEELQEEDEEEEEIEEAAPVDGILPSHNLLSVSENYDDFRADREAKLKEWLEGNGNLDKCREASDAERP